MGGKHVQLLLQMIFNEGIYAPSHSQDIPEVPVEVPSNIASTAQHTASSLKKVGTKKKSDLDQIKVFILLTSNHPIGRSEILKRNTKCALSIFLIRISASDDRYTYKKYPLSVNLPYRKEHDHSAGNYHRSVGNETTTSVPVDCPSQETNLLIPRPNVSYHSSCCSQRAINIGIGFWLTPSTAQQNSVNHHIDNKKEIDSP
ncbi:hypothetical protein Tco_0206278 [Tanacetum coccineum]